MKNFIGRDGLVLCVVKGKKDIERWISEIDILDHSIISYEELINSINSLLKGNIIYIKKGKFKRSYLAKKILIGFWMGAIDWQLKVQERITKYSYDEKSVNTFDFSREEYEIALNRYFERMDKILSKMKL